MRHFDFTIVIIFILSYSFSLHSQTLDTLVDVGGYNMHFNIIKGEGTPILFEAGGGNNGSVWNGILESIHKVTGTTLITYDRSGFGKSELNPNITEDSKFGILNGIKELETGLKILGFDDDIILVSHSYGGFYNALYASKHPKNVKHIILIDVVTNSLWNDELLGLYHSDPVLKKDYQENMGMYYLDKNYTETANIMRNITFPPNCPIINIFSENSFSDAPEAYTNRWIKLHKEFGDHKDNIKNIIAQGSAHYIFRDNPGLIINSIIKAYIKTLDEDMQNAILKKALDNAIELSVEAKKREMETLHSESDFNSWGYQFMRSGQLMKALEVFKLNVFLFPESWNVYDSYGEALMNAKRNEEAIEMYAKSIALNPENDNGKKMLLKLKQE
jgi:pimeloyl-ACP methyl ester carboxylesterase